MLNRASFTETAELTTFFNGDHKCLDKESMLYTKEHYLCLQRIVYIVSKQAVHR